MMEKIIISEQDSLLTFWRLMSTIVVVPHR